MSRCTETPCTSSRPCPLRHSGSGPYTLFSSLRYVRTTLLHLWVCRTLHGEHTRTCVRGCPCGTRCTSTRTRFWWVGVSWCGSPCVSVGRCKAFPSPQTSPVVTRTETQCLPWVGGSLLGQVETSLQGQTLFCGRVPLDPGSLVGNTPPSLDGEGRRPGRRVSEGFGVPVFLCTPGSSEGP